MIATILMVAITVVLSGVLYVWAANLAESNTDGAFEMYTFSANSAPGELTSDTNDNLIIVTMDQGEDIDWAKVDVKISIAGAASVSCAVPGESTGSCIVLESEPTGNIWEIGESITIKENGVDLCNGELCEVSVSIINSREGITLDESSTIAESTASTESSSEMAEEFFRLLMETFITGDGDTFYSYFEGNDVVFWGGLTGCLEYEDSNENGEYDDGETCNFDTSIESIRYHEESLCPDSTDEFCHPIGRDYSDYTMENLISDYDFVIKDNSQILDGDCGFVGYDDSRSDEEIREDCIEFVVENSNWESNFGDNDYLAFTKWKYDYNQNQHSNWFWDDPTVMVISYDEGEWKISWWLGLD